MSFSFFHQHLENKTNLQEVIRAKLDLKDLEKDNEETITKIHILKSKTKLQKDMANLAIEYQEAKFKAEVEAEAEAEETNGLIY
ncbi:hypothetical protein PHYBLDRAFT_149344 [Phycomyces blakesleeanus NRRL 1555(-)]|uniref:Uncharacterized protein n=1 Tax=Phycomyces blakesleeanus (strain ATCC 8743b / DSM 1359 / FGSC 10004 / NBRC 33097 / NRRL 1555) TaxID=763407 RepID=A0A162WQ18_PHYB8|nr:hypothetical protein PHYBLDRAFT_149344 [Phycomyces blakesleeanus NRRL 1555(-)]OAD69555.1 hypothetical protein PHYBLDRAFT_149344 [Phycomyces blakesleeanus NRRL 1555(-)]|eukprot:XP_018287595.1 hypothetical protein PHYBLDRAFT_149344 [Phycomyces blakesleeanus NRRL 1555(-)]